MEGRVCFQPPLHSTQALVAGYWLYVFSPAALSSFSFHSTLISLYQIKHIHSFLLLSLMDWRQREGMETIEELLKWISLRQIAGLPAYNPHKEKGKENKQIQSNKCRNCFVWWIVWFPFMKKEEEREKKDTAALFPFLPFSLNSFISFNNSKQKRKQRRPKTN